jgi:hypothetical protein
VVDAERGQLPQVLEKDLRSSPRVVSQVGTAGDGLLDLGEITADRVAVLTQDPELVLDVAGEFGAGPVEQVAGIGVLRDEPQRLAFTAAADEDRRVRALYGVRRVERARQPVVLALEGLLVTAPHLMRDPQDLLKPLEPLG